MVKKPEPSPFAIRLFRRASDRVWCWLVVRSKRHLVASSKAAGWKSKTAATQAALDMIPGAEVVEYDDAAAALDGLTTDDVLTAVAGGEIEEEEEAGDTNDAPSETETPTEDDEFDLW